MERLCLAALRGATLRRELLQTLRCEHRDSTALGGDDGLDNEVITVDFSRLKEEANYIAFVLNSFKGQDFGTIPFASIRIYEGTPTKVNSVVAKFDIANDQSFSGHVSMVMGIFYKKSGEWKFNAIGEATKDKKLQETIGTVTQKYL